MSASRSVAEPVALRRSSGVLLHPRSLPSGRLGPEAYRFVDWLEAAGQSWWQILPLGPPGAPAHDRSVSSIVVYDAATGRLLRTVTVAASASDLGASGDCIVYRTGKQIRLLRHPNPIVVASGNPVGLSISGNRVGWGDATGFHFVRVP